MTYKPDDEKALDMIGELFKTIIATAGIVLTLLWGLLEPNIDPTRLFWTKVCSVVLLIAITCALLGLQFMVSALQNKVARVSRDGLVAACFFSSWISFLGGCVLLIVAIYH